MKTAQEIASKVVDKYQDDRQYPVGKAQQMVLDALGITTKLNGHNHAQQIFDELGIVVSGKRVGRTSVPVVTKVSGGSQQTGYGDYEVWGSPAEDVDLSAIEQWMNS